MPSINKQQLVLKLIINISQKQSLIHQPTNPNYVFITHLTNTPNSQFSFKNGKNRNYTSSQQYFQTQHMHFNFKKDQAQADQVKPQNWIDTLKKQLIRKNNTFLNTHLTHQSSLTTSDLWQIVSSSPRLTQSDHNVDLLDKCQGHYSQYVPISKTHYFPNQLSEYFHYLKYLVQNKKAQSEKQLFIYIMSQVISNNSCYEQWKKLCKTYVVPMPIEDLFQNYHLLLIKGLTALDQIQKEKFNCCKKQAIFAKILQLKKFIQNYDKMNSLMTVSIEKGEQINLQNLSKTLKNLFCSICLIYDCQKHLQPSNVVKNNFQYIQNYDARIRMQEKKKTSLQLFEQMIVIHNETNPQRRLACSKTCFRTLDKTKWMKLCQLKQTKIFSPIFKSMVRMGVQIFDYSCCSITNLFENTTLNAGNSNCSFKVTCQDIYYYLIQQYNLLQKIRFKFFDSQSTELKNQFKYYGIHKETADRKIKKKIVKKSNNPSNYHQYNSVCYHFFLDQEPSDLNCLSCDCQRRGYCTPECVCSQLCELKQKGCKCKQDSSCWQNKCVCFKSKRVCRPQICQHCCRESSNKERINWCQNNQLTFSRSKKTSIGISTIPNAGFGLFSREFILKNSFVIKYLGQIVDSLNVQKLRQNLVKDNLFYTFKLTDNQSLDSRLYGNKSRFINHSTKDPNICPTTIRMNQQEILIFYALRDIFEDQQLLFNYNGQGDLSQFKDKFPFID